MSVAAAREPMIGVFSAVPCSRASVHAASPRPAAGPAPRCPLGDSTYEDGGAAGGGGGACDDAALFSVGRADAGASASVSVFMTKPLADGSYLRVRMVLCHGSAHG